MNHDIHLWVARLFLVGLVIFAVYYPWTFLYYQWSFSFSGPEGWQGHWMVDQSALVPFGHRLMFFVIWLPAVVATELMVLFAIWLSVLVLRGIHFELSTVRALQRVGLSAAVAGASMIVAMCFADWMLTAYNAENIRPIRLHLESGEIGVFLSGAGVYLLGHVVKVTALMARENKEFV